MICNLEPRRHRTAKLQHRKADLLDALTAHLIGLRRHLAETGRPAEAEALITDLAIVAELRGAS
ncbi:MAG: hypothetical protein V4515_01810 [Chloroflexota bacterium]